jgi:hypothetical protein
MSRDPEFTFAQLAAIETVIHSKHLRRKLKEWDDAELKDLELLVWRLPAQTTRQYVTQSAIFDKVRAELTRRAV